MHTTRARTSPLDRMMTLNRALDQALASAWTGDNNRVWVPAIDVVERKDAYTLYAEVPGVDASQIDMCFEQGVLTIRGTKRSNVEASTGDEVRVYASERVSGSFERSIRLPEFVDGEQIAADFTNGLLTVTVPKAQAAQARRIEIRSPLGNASQATQSAARSNN